MEMDVEIWSDIACPWCYIGKRRFEDALARFEHRDEVNVRWRSFELEPDAPAAIEGERVQRLADKYGMTVERARELEAGLAETAAGEGLGFRFDLIRGGNSFEGHRLVHLAAAHGLQDAMKERLLRAYFGEGRLLSDHETLTALGREVGLPEEEIRTTLAGEAYAEEVRADEETAAGLGIGAVPTFVVDRTLGVSGAQPPEVLLAFLREGFERGAAVEVAAEGEAGGPEGS